ncbi:MAG: hypothetical protein AB7O98_09345 [Hyphomonadaceae bacterium]
MNRMWMALCVSAALGACASAGGEDELGDLLAGGRAPPARLERLVAEAARHPLGSRENPIRVNMPAGERAYLSRLRCSDGGAPAYERQGNGGAGAFGSIVDIYLVRCLGGEPRQTTIWMDMYHPQHNETAAPPGFTLSPH